MKSPKDITPEEYWPVSDWQYDVAGGDTKLGYQEWLQHQIESNPKWRQQYAQCDLNALACTCDESHKRCPVHDMDFSDEELS